jgi:2-polyprenyl-3-methyl-5-hydroxy-6-metoxy-1,4-benzoquinol methylase
MLRSIRHAREEMTTKDASTTQREGCPFCDDASSRMDFAFSAEDQSGQIPGTFSVYRCRTCKTGVTEISVNDAFLHQMYDEYYDTQNLIRIESHPLHRRYRRTHLQRLLPLARGTNLLDLGCGAGMFVKAASEKGFNATGVDISPASVECGRKLWNLDIACATVSDYTAKEENRGRFNIVTLYSVMEHIANPHETLAAVRTMLAEGGVLVIEVPDFHSIQARLFGAHWFHLDVPRHLFHYSPEGLKRLVQSAGFDVIAVRPGPAAIDYGIAASMMRMPESGESLVHKVIRKLIVTPFGRALVPLERLFGTGGSVEVYARKNQTG